MKNLIESEKSSQEIVNQLTESLPQDAVSEIIFTAAEYTDEDLSALAGRQWSSRASLINQIVNDHMQGVPAKDVQDFVQQAGG